MGDDDGFLRAIGAAPADKVIRLVYADWLEERGDERGEYLHISAKLMEAAGKRKSPNELQARYKELRLRIDCSWIQATDWPAPKPKFAIRCVFGIMHSWDGCVCSHCEAVSKDPTRHAWVGCRCIRCGQRREIVDDSLNAEARGQKWLYPYCIWPRASCSGSGGCEHTQCSICGVVFHDWGPWVDMPGSHGYSQTRNCTRNGCSATGDWHYAP
jgi:uncharacterized protein (TIGR02996 family)